MRLLSGLILSNVGLFPIVCGNFLDHRLELDSQRGINPPDEGRDILELRHALRRGELDLRHNGLGERQIELINRRKSGLVRMNLICLNHKYCYQSRTYQ